MKKILLLILCTVCTVFFTSCDNKKEVSANVNFEVISDCGSDANLEKIVNLLKSKNLPVGDNIPTSAEGDNEKDLEIRVKQILADFIIRVSDEELKALNTGATFVMYKATFSGFSTPIGASQKDF